MTVGPQHVAEDPIGPLGTDDEILLVPDALPARSRAETPGPISATAPPSGSALVGFRRIVAVLLVADAGCILGALLLAHAGELTKDLVAVMLLAPIMWVLVFQSFRLYGVRHLSPQEEFRRLVSATALAVVLITVGSVWWDEGLARWALAVTWLVALLLELVVRRVARWHIRAQKRSGRLALRTLIVGTNDEAEEIAGSLSAPVRGFVPLGFVASSVASREPRGLPVMGSIDDLVATIGKMSAECVFVASSSSTPDDVYRVARSCREANIEMRVSANTPQVLTSRVSVQQVDKLMMLAVRPVKLSRAESAVKRCFDITVTSVALVVAMPLMGLIALAIRLGSRGPALFRQERVTMGGRSFTIYKFRTMVVDPEEATEGHVFDLTKPFFKMVDDPRLTKVGGILRSLSLDELPQLWNVIRGDMSLVGPRPLPVEQVAANPDLLEPRHEVRAGLTGWWQIHGRNDTETEEALRMDLFYIENWSLMLDLYVLLKTVGVVITRRGAY